MSSLLPFVFLNMAMTADGKIATLARSGNAFGSTRDQAQLYALRARADAIMAGARTIEAGPVQLDPGPAKYRHLRQRQGLAEYPVRIIASGSGMLDPEAAIFRNRWGPLIIFTTERCPPPRRKALRRRADQVKIVGQKEIDFVRALTWLRQEWNVRQLLVEGGGVLNAALFEARLVQELHLTICPLIFGGRTAPTLAEGAGIRRLAAAPRFQLVSRRRVGQELFLVYRLFLRRSQGEDILAHTIQIPTG